MLVLLHLGSVGWLLAVVVHVLTNPAGMPLPGRLVGVDELTSMGTRLSLVALGLYLFLSGRWVIGRLTRGLAWPGGGTCHKCGYDITGVDSPRCPECGTKMKR